MRLKEWLEDEGLLRVEFAAQVGVHPITMTRWVTGAWVPSSEYIERIAELTGGKVTANDLMEQWAERRRGTPPVWTPEDVVAE